MIIENSTILQSSSELSHYRLPVILGTIITLTAVALPLLFIFVIKGQPTGSLLSPLPAGEIAETITPPDIPTETPIVAAPAASSSSDGGPQGLLRGGTYTNADRKLITLPAGKNEVVIWDKKVTSDSYIYIVPISETNDPITVKTKGEGYFIVGTKKVPQADLLLEYYLVNE